MNKTITRILPIALFLICVGQSLREVNGQATTNNGLVPCTILGVATLCPAPCPNCVRARVIATRFEVHTGTIDGHLVRDGRGDEIFVAASVAELTAANSLLRGVAHKRSAFYGDTDGRAGPVYAAGIPLEHARSTQCDFIVKAGTGSPVSGGLLSGNFFPDPAITQTRRPAAGICDGRLIPFTLWEGELRPIDSGATAVMIFPTIWENDYQEDIYNIWNSQAAAWLNRYAADSKRDVLGTPTGRRALLQREEVVLRTVPNRNDFDRPIGITGAPYDPFPAQRADAEFAPHSLFLTAATLDAAIARGEFGIHYRDGERYGPGDYTLFVRVERVRR
jgi:hypothetical protein